MSKAKILVVDDHPSNVKAIRMKLQAEGHEILEASNGEEALESLRQLVDANPALLPARVAAARLALVVAKASYQVDESLVEAVLGDDRSETRLIRVLAFASFSAARFRRSSPRFANNRPPCTTSSMNCSNEIAFHRFEPRSPSRFPPWSTSSTPTSPPCSG